jgi:hypothetical protein
MVPYFADQFDNLEGTWAGQGMMDGIRLRPSSKATGINRPVVAAHDTATKSTEPAVPSNSRLP